MINKEDIQKRINEEEDFIYCPKHGNSLSKFVLMNPDGAKDHSIARFLMISEEEVEKIYQEAVELLRKETIDKF